MADVYAQTMEQIALVDRLGLDLVWFSEHHFVEDGYLPNFVPVAAAAAAMTSRIRIGTDIALAPFAHPLRLAEDMGILDQLSNGRMELGLGLGYAPHEFAAFGMPRSHRVSTPRRPWRSCGWRGPASGSPSTASAGRSTTCASPRSRCSQAARRCGRRRPARPASARAVRFDTHLLPQGTTAVVLDPWRDQTRACRPRPRRATASASSARVLVTDDPERDWPPVHAAERYRMKVYGGFAEAAGLGGQGMFKDAERIPQRIIIGDVAHCVDELSAFIARTA